MSDDEVLVSSAHRVALQYRWFTNMPSPVCGALGLSGPDGTRDYVVLQKGSEKLRSINQKPKKARSKKQKKFAILGDIAAHGPIKASKSTHPQENSLPGEFAKQTCLSKT